MSQSKFARLRAAVTGVMFGIATLAGAVVPALSAHAVMGTYAGPTNFAATWDAANSRFNFSVTATTAGNLPSGASCSPATECYQVMMRRTGGTEWNNVTNAGYWTDSNNYYAYASAYDYYGYRGSGPRPSVSVVPGASYDFQLSASTSTANGANNYRSAPVVITAVAATSGAGTTFTPAGAPTNVTATYNIRPSFTNVNMTWTAPTAIGDSAVDGYGVFYRQQGATTWDNTYCSVDSATTSASVGPSECFMDLTQGTTYEFGVAASNDKVGLSSNIGAAAAITYTGQSVTSTAGGGTGAGADPTVTLPVNNSSYVTFSDLTANGGQGLSSPFYGGTNAAQNVVLGYMTDTATTPTARPVVQATFNLSAGNVDGSNISYQTDLAAYKAFAHNVAEKAVGGKYTLFIPAKAGDKAVGICPGAASLDAVKAGCDKGYYLTDGATKKGATAKLITVGGVQYWQVDGLTGTGGFSTPVTAPDTGFGLVLANPLLVIGLGIVAAGSLALIGRKFARR